MSESAAELHVFSVDDGGEVWWYVDESKELALSVHIKMNYDDVGVPLPKDEPFLSEDVTQLADDTVLKINDVGMKTAGEWAATEKKGLLACTCY